MSQRIWEVTGGKTAGGVVVRTGKDTKSDESPGGRLATGSIVAELELDGERLRYTLLSGEGPREGWVSLKFKTNTLLTPAGAKGSKAAKEALEVEEAKRTYGAEGKKRVWLMPQGTRGDCQPFVALGVGLRKAGMDVRILASANFKTFVESYGLAFTEQGVDAQSRMKVQSGEFMKGQDTEELKKQYKEDPLKLGGDCLNEWYGSVDVLRSGVQVLLELLEREKPDIIMAHGLNRCIPFFAWRKHGVPVYGIEFFPSMISSPEDMQAGFDGLVEDAKRIEGDIGFNPFDGVNATEFIAWRLQRNYCACHPDVINKLAEELDDAIKLGASSLCKGFLVLDPTLQMVDTQSFGGHENLLKMQEYLDAGPPPVYLGWGSMPVPTLFLAKFVLIFKMNKCRAIICAGWGGHNLEGLKEFVAENMPDDPMGLLDYATNQLLFVEVAPHEWLLPRCAVTIHHGGAGTTNACLRAGVPTIVTPFLVDQFAYAAWVESLGCGLKLGLMDSEKLMDPTWSKALRKSLTDEAMKNEARKVAEELHSRNAVDDMVSFVEDLVKQSREREPDGKRELGC